MRPRSEARKLALGLRTPFVLFTRTHGLCVRSIPRTDPITIAAVRAENVPSPPVTPSESALNTNV